MYCECTTCTICCIARTRALFIHISRSSFHNRSWSLSYGFFVFLAYASQNKRFPIVFSAGTNTHHLTRQHRSHNDCSGYLCSHLNPCAAIPLARTCFPRCRRQRSIFSFHNFASSRHTHNPYVTPMPRRSYHLLGYVSCEAVPQWMVAS